MGILLRLRAMFGDPVLLLAVVLLSVFGIAMIYSAGQLDVPSAAVARLWRMQAIWFVLSLAALFVVMRVQVRWLEWVSVPAYVLAMLSLVATLVIGTGAGTAESTRSWLQVGPVRIQPAQFANVATILMLGRVMGGWREMPRSLFGLWKPVAIVFLPMALVMQQPDLGTAMVFGGVIVATLYWAGTPLGLMFMLLSPMIALFLAFQGWIFSVFMVLLLAFLVLYRTYLWEGVLVVSLNLMVGAVAVPLWNTLEPYQRNRFTAFLDPYSDPRGSGYHHIQSQVAIGSGGLTGQGFTQGSQKRLAFLPEQQTDFIYAVIGEEFGFVGAALVILTYCLILWRLIRVAERLSDPFAGIVVFGIFGAWFTHILVNVGMTIGVMPITGIPLPFLSYGGSFLLATYVGLGLVQRVALEQGKV